MSNPVINIRDRRKALKLTLEDVGKFVGVSKGTVSKWENGNIKNMRSDKIALLAQILDISVMEILGNCNPSYTVNHSGQPSGTVGMGGSGQAHGTIGAGQEDGTVGMGSTGQESGAVGTGQESGGANPDTEQDTDDNGGVGRIVGIEVKRTYNPKMVRNKKSVGSTKIPGMDADRRPSWYLPVQDENGQIVYMHPDEVDRGYRFESPKPFVHPEELHSKRPPVFRESIDNDKFLVMYQDENHEPHYEEFDREDYEYLVRTIMMLKSKENSNNG